MEKPIIEIKHLGKRYNIAHQRGGYVTLRDVLAYMIRRPFRFLTERAKKAVGMGGREEFWALKDISLRVQKGEIIGVIGRNGAGKSTLLKILTGITPPTEGEAVLRGRVSSLLEVGTGFHPELTGRENIFLNGAILGMTRREIAQKFDEIVAFAGVERFIDTPVKYYSSGMYVRLAFSVAAHMEPDILIVDEVLAVGDAEFQKKCLGKMEEVTRREGRTIIFVSHNLSAIQELCHKTLMLDKGRMVMFDETEQVIASYLGTSLREESVTQTFPEDLSKKMQIRSATLRNAHGKPAVRLPANEPWSLEIEYDVREEIPGSHVGIICRNQNDATIFVSADTDDHPELLKVRRPGTYRSTFKLPPGPMHLGKSVYFIQLYLEITNFAFDRLELSFEVLPPGLEPDFGKNKPTPALITEGSWHTVAL